MSWRDIFTLGRPKAQASKEHALDAQDLQILKLIAKHGGNLALPRDRSHYLYLPTYEAAMVVVEQLRPLGYSVDLHQSNGEDPKSWAWMAVAQIVAVTDHKTMTEAKRLFSELAERCSGIYDGWEAAVKP